MKYQTRIILYYMSIAAIFSLLLGIVIYRISSGYEQSSRANEVAVSSRQLVAQIEDRMDRMDAIINYILSDPAVLDSIGILGLDGDGKLPAPYVAEAESEILSGINTDYIIRNTHRTVFYNQTGHVLSSYVSDISNQRLNGNYSAADVPYLKEAEAAKGKTVIIGPHEDRWGMYDGSEVFSLIKALQGYNMGYIETENTLDSLKDLDVPDEQTEYAVFINGEELLFSGNDAYDEAFLRELLKQYEGAPFRSRGFICASDASKLYDFKVLALKNESALKDEKGTLLLTAVLSALAVFTAGLIFVIILSYALVRPVKALRGVMEKTNLENMQLVAADTELDRGPDEFRQLAASYQAMTERLDKAVQNERRSAILTLQAQFDTLQTQVNPHFIYNVLNIISARGVLDDDEAICQMCGSLAEMLRYSTSNKERYAFVSAELKYLENYFYLIKARYEDRFEYGMNIDEAVKDKLIPKMVLQQLAENSLTHGFEDHGGLMRIDIQGHADEAGWEITVSDNGAGFEEEKLKNLQKKLEETRENVLGGGAVIELEIGGMGIVNTYARCLMLFGDRLIFTMENTGTGAKVTVGERG
ncbi:MAG: histidine kinase [Lachnospiraceae bacterium]|nr:histidine kinase [Lachnospiraceae bacterium]